MKTLPTDLAKCKPGGGAHVSTTLTVAIPAESLTVIASPPELLSQRNVEAVTGIPARAFLEELRAPGFPVKVIKLGKLRLVDRAAFVAWLRERAEQAPPPSAPANDVEGQGGEVAAVLDELGCAPTKARASGGRGRR